MASPLFTNNAASGLVYPISAVDVTLYLNGGSGSLFPNPTGSNYFMITLISSSSGNMEIVQCTARSGDTFTKLTNPATLPDFAVKEVLFVPPLATAKVPATTTGAGIQVSAANTQGGIGYADFLKVTNTSAGATNPKRNRRPRTVKVEACNLV